MRDLDVNGELVCTLCNMPNQYLDNGSNEYKLTIGHINYPTPNYSNIYNTNDETNLTPQHDRCNKLLQGKDFYQKHSDKLLQTLEKNIQFSKSQFRNNLDFAKENTIAEDSSSIQNKKSKIYGAKCYQYLSTYLVDGTSKIEFDTAAEDISGICESVHNFGNEVSIKRHLAKICNRFKLLYVIEPNEDAIDIIRLMRPEEKTKYEKQLSLFKPKTGSGSFV